MKAISGLIPLKAGWVAMMVMAMLVGVASALANDAYQTGSGHGYDSGSCVGQGAFKSAYDGGLGDGYDFCFGTRGIPGTIFRIAWIARNAPWMLHAPSLAQIPAGRPAVAGHEKRPEPMSFAERAKRAQNAEWWWRQWK